LPAHAVHRVQDLLGPARHEPVAAERDLRRSIVRAKIEQLEAEDARISAEVAAAGSPVSLELVNESGIVARRIVDYRKRLEALNRG
jgi:hypothetical protein